MLVPILQDQVEQEKFDVVINEDLMSIRDSTRNIVCSAVEGKEMQMILVNPIQRTD